MRSRLRLPIAGPDRRQGHSGLSARRQIKFRAGQPLVEKPDAPCVASGRLIAHKLFDGSRAGREEQTLEEREVEAFIFKSEGQMACECRVRGVAWRHNAPACRFNDAMALAGRV
jgi:hypothetical protein